MGQLHNLLVIEPGQRLRRAVFLVLPVARDVAATLQQAVKGEVVQVFKALVIFPEYPLQVFRHVVGVTAILWRGLDQLNDVLTRTEHPHKVGACPFDRLEHFAGDDLGAAVFFVAVKLTKVAPQRFHLLSRDLSLSITEGVFFLGLEHAHELFSTAHLLLLLTQVRL